MRVGKGFGLAMAAALAVAACGGDDDDGETAGTEAPGTESPGTTAGGATSEPATTGAASETTTAGTASGTAGGGDCTLDEPLKIGYAADFSDFGGFADVPGSEAAGVQVDLLNEAGGVGGQPVEYVVKELPERPVRRPARGPGAARRGRRRDHRPAVRLQRRAADRHRRRPGADHLQRVHRPRPRRPRPAARS